jgi:hypothetical protein
MKFEEIINLIANEKYVSPNHLTKNSFVFVSNNKWTSDYLKHYYNLVLYLKEKYNIDFEIVGGGKSCSKIIVEATFDDNEIIDLLNIFNTDSKLIELSKNLDLKFLVHISNKQSLNFENKIISDTTPYNIHNTYDIYLNSTLKSNELLELSSNDNEMQDNLTNNIQ